MRNCLFTHSEFQQRSKMFFKRDFDDDVILMLIKKNLSIWILNIRIRLRKKKLWKYTQIVFKFSIILKNNKKKYTNEQVATVKAKELKYKKNVMKAIDEMTSRISLRSKLETCCWKKNVVSKILRFQQKIFESFQTKTKTTKKNVFIAKIFMMYVENYILNWRLIDEKRNKKIITMKTTNRIFDSFIHLNFDSIFEKNVWNSKLHEEIKTWNCYKIDQERAECIVCKCDYFTAKWSIENISIHE